MSLTSLSLTNSKKNQHPYLGADFLFCFEQ